MSTGVKNILFGLSAFIIFMLISLVLKLVSNRIPENADYFGLFTNSDILIGLMVAILVTFTHIRRKNLK
ncbi:MAG: hypothetical protein H6Q20_1754 [Bacteroidetes bacterium]|jgi:chromate transport protein ChrA|nr:hypothetical protein [Bacteroidota bacterium]